MHPVAVQRQGGRRHRLVRPEGVALDAGNLDEAADRVAGHAEMVLHRDLGRVRHLARAAAQHCGEPRRRHRGGRADLALAADLGARDRGAALDQPADRGRREQVVAAAGLAPVRAEIDDVAQDRRHDPGRPVGRGRDHAPARGVLLVHREREQADPVHDLVGRPAVGELLGLQRLVQAPGAPAHLEAAGQLPVHPQAAGDAGEHRVADRVEAVLDLSLAAQGALVGHLDLRDRQAGLGADPQEVGPAVERVGNRSGFDPRRSRIALLLDEAAADRVAHHLVEEGARRVEGAEPHPVGVARQDLGEVEREVAGGLEDEPRQSDLAGLRQDSDVLRHPVGIDGGGLVPEKPQEDRHVGGVAAPGPGQRPEDLRGDPRRAGQGRHALAEAARGDHRADRVRARRADADLEQIEGADHRAGTRSTGWAAMAAS